MDFSTIKNHETLIFFPLYDKPEVDHRCCRRLNTHWDYPVQEHLDINTYYETLLTHNPTNQYYWVLHGETKDIIALTGIQHHPGYQNWHTTTMVSGPYRKQGVFTYLNLVHAGVFKTLETPLYATIKTDNPNAASALNKMPIPPNSVIATIEKPYNYHTNPVTPPGIFNEQQHIHYDLSDIKIVDNPTINKKHYKLLKPVYETLITKVKNNPNLGTTIDTME